MDRVGGRLSCLLVALVGCRPDVPNATGYLGEGETGSTSLGAMESTSTGPTTVDSSAGPATEGVTGTTAGVITEGVTTEGVTTEGATTEGATTEGATTEGATTEGTTTEGATTEVGPVCGDGIAEGLEQCDGPELGGASCESEGFDAGVLGCQPDCVAYDTSGCITFTCGNGMIEGVEACDDGGESAVCDDDCTPVECGDLVVNGVAGEACEGLDLDGASCVTEGFDGGSLACDGACQLDTTGCFVCGDGLLDPGEACDGANLGAGTCESLGFDGGVLDCSMGCAYDTNACYVCGDGVVEPGEQCDDGGESATCNIDCTPAVCGDGYTNVAAGEVCDDAGESAACDDDCTPVECGDGVVNTSAGEQCEGGAGCDVLTCQFSGDCFPDPVAVAMAVCLSEYTNCDIQAGGVVGWNAPFCTGCNCGTPLDPWRWYCTADDLAGANYNCSACTVGQILGPHDPCNCGLGTSPVLGNFCAI